MLSSSANMEARRTKATITIMKGDEDLKLTLSQAADLVGLTRQTLWEWSRKGWIKPLRAVVRTGGRPGQVYSALAVIAAVEERQFITAEQAAKLRASLKKRS